MMLFASDVYRHLTHLASQPVARRTAVAESRPAPHVAIRAIAEAWRAKHVAKGRREYDAPLEEVATPIDAYINEGRYLVDCVCANGVPLSSVGEGAEAVCFVCGTVWTQIVFPENRVAIERVLEQRRWRKHQNWRPHETLEDLERENAEHPDGIRAVVAAAQPVQKRRRAVPR